MLSELNTVDFNNLLALLQRVQVNGLNEAQALVVLAAKLQAAANPPVLAAPEVKAAE
jgi:hypothetical protein